MPTSFTLKETSRTHPDRYLSLLPVAYPYDSDRTIAAGEVIDWVTKHWGAFEEIPWIRRYHASPRLTFDADWECEWLLSMMHNVTEPEVLGYSKEFTRTR